MSVEFRYELTGSGWSECTLIVGEVHVSVTASYLSDALRSLLSAVCRILSGANEATASFDEEPGEYRWRFLRVDDERLRIRIFEFDDLWSDRPDSDGQQICDVECRLRTFAGAVLSGCKDLLATHGRDGYKEKWVRHHFPDANYDELRRLLLDKARL